MAVHAVIFDLDGTLLDTLDDIADSANHVLAARGYPTHPVDDYRFFVGAGVKMLIHRVLPDAERTAELVDRCLADMRAEYGRRWNVKTKPYEGVPEMLDGLESRGLKLSVLSNKPDDFTKMCVAEYLSHWRFDAVAGHSPDVPHKPDPAGALGLARRIDTSAKKIIFLGDSDIDMKTAVAAGMRPVGVSWGYRPREELLQSGASMVLEEPTELLSLFGVVTKADVHQGEFR